jgi:hypothetical protein
LELKSLIEEYKACDPRTLEPGPVTYDIHPDGHVSVEPPPINSVDAFKEAVVERKRLPGQ